MNVGDLTSKCEHFTIVVEWKYVVIYSFESILLKEGFFENEVSNTPDKAAF